MKCSKFRFQKSKKVKKKKVFNVYLMVRNGSFYLTVSYFILL